MTPLQLYETEQSELLALVIEGCRGELDRMLNNISQADNVFLWRLFDLLFANPQATGITWPRHSYWSCDLLMMSSLARFLQDWFVVGGFCESVSAADQCAPGGWGGGGGRYYSGNPQEPAPGNGEGPPVSGPGQISVLIVGQGPFPPQAFYELRT